MDRFATRVWELRDGTIHDYKGSYQKYRAIRAHEPPPAPAPAKEKKPPREKPKGGTKNLDKQIARLEREIEKQEAAVAAYDPQIAAAASDYQELGRLMGEKEQAEAVLADLYEQWETLSAQLEEQG